MIRTLDELPQLVAQTRGQAGPVPIAVVKAADTHVLDAVVPAALQGLVRPILIDDEARTRELLAGRLADDTVDFVDIADDVQAAARGVELVRAGQASVLMKGLVSSSTFLKPVVNKETGIRTSPLMSHVAVVDHPSIGRPVAFTDGGMLTVPTAEQYPALVEHAALVMRALGVTTPRTALLSAAENVIPRLPSAQLQAEVSASDWAVDTVVEGPISLDLALSPESVQEKGYRGHIQGNADVVVAPDIVTANATVKALTMFGGGRMAGLVLGASAPIVLVSRSATADEKYSSLLLAALMGGAA